MSETRAAIFRSVSKNLKTQSLALSSETLA
jgi:hypothetical protein